MPDSKSQVPFDLAALLLRATFGGLMLIEHGLGKVERLSAEPIRFADPLGLGAELSLQMAIGAEVVCAALLVLGVASRLVLANPKVYEPLIDAF